MLLIVRGLISQPTTTKQKHPPEHGDVTQLSLKNITLHANWLSRTIINDDEIIETVEILQLGRRH